MFRSILTLSALTLALWSGAGLHARADSSTICNGASNSVGSGATLQWTGTFQPSQGTLLADQLPPHTFGMMIYSSSSTNVPFGNGTLCVGAPTWILARTRTDALGGVQLNLATQGENEDVRWLDFAWRVYGVDTWFFQYWYRDAAGGGAMHNLSDAIRVTFE